MGELTLEKAIEMFSLRTETNALSITIATLNRQLGEVVSRHEHEARWKADDLRFERIENKLDSLETKVDDINGHFLPRWVLPVLAVLVPVLMALLLYFLPHR